LRRATQGAVTLAAQHQVSTAYLRVAKRPAPEQSWMIVARLSPGPSACPPSCQATISLPSSPPVHCFLTRAGKIDLFVEPAVHLEPLSVSPRAGTLHPRAQKYKRMHSRCCSATPISRANVAPRVYSCWVARARRQYMFPTAHSARSVCERLRSGRQRKCTEAHVGCLFSPFLSPISLPPP